MGAYIEWLTDAVLQGLSSITGPSAAERCAASPGAMESPARGSRAASFEVLPEPFKAPVAEVRRRVLVRVHPQAVQ